MTINRYIVDTNVLISAALSEASLPRQVLDQVLADGVLLFSEVTFNELRDTLFRPKFNRYLRESTRVLFIATLVNHIEMITVQQQVHVCRDPKDNAVLDVALNGQATCIITGDQDLLELHPYQGMSILTPRDFLSL